MNIEIKGLIEERKRNDATIAALHGQPILQAFHEAGMLVTRTARQESSVDTGRLRASIVPEVRLKGDVIQGIVGSNVEYAREAILGTEPHRVSGKDLLVWASRHHVNAYAVAAAIGKRGTKGDQSLLKGIDQNADKIIRLITNAIGKIVG
jgi:hypothetical protein